MVCGDSECLCVGVICAIVQLWYSAFLWFVGSRLVRSLFSGVFFAEILQFFFFFFRFCYVFFLLGFSFCIVLDGYLV